MFKKFAVLFYSIFVLNLVSAQHGEATAEAGPATTELSEKDKVSKENKSSHRSSLVRCTRLYIDGR
jgi:F-type H+-transporting ATPase subunit a